MRKRNIIMAAGACLAALTMIAPSALADPSGPTVPPGPHRPLNGVGSDTTQDVMNALSNLITIGGNKQISSWDASGSPNPFSTGALAACTLTRTSASGSGNGVARLRDSMRAPNNCLQFARSSSSSTTTVPVDATAPVSLVPFATDAVSYVIRTDNNFGLPLSLSQGDLQAIYNCAPGLEALRPKVPQFGSGTRSTFINTVLGLGPDSATWATDNGRGACVEQVDDNNNPLLENNGLLLTEPNVIAPYSVGKWNAQINRVVDDEHGRTILGLVDSVPANVPNAAQRGARTVFNVIPTSQEAVAPTSTVFVGPGSSVCANGTEIARQGFAPLPAGTCGVITIRR